MVPFKFVRQNFGDILVFLPNFFKLLFVVSIKTNLWINTSETEKKIDRINLFSIFKYFKSSSANNRQIPILCALLLSIIIILYIIQSLQIFNFKQTFEFIARMYSVTQKTVWKMLILIYGVSH